jgi:hypothetical protein
MTEVSRLKVGRKIVFARYSLKIQICRRGEYFFDKGSGGIFDKNEVITLCGAILQEN